MSRNELGERVRLFRQKKQLTQKELAAALVALGLERGDGSSHQNISAIERGASFPSPELLAGLERVLGVPLLEDLRIAKTPSAAAPGLVRVRAHLFYPLGVDCSQYEDLAGVDFQARQILAARGRLGEPHAGEDVIVFAFHVAVLHQVVELEMASLTDVCVWRHKLLNPVGDAAAQALASRSGVPPRVHDREPYCLTCFEVIELPWDGAARRKAIEILAMPSALGRAGYSSRSKALALEQQLLYRTDRHEELVNFSGEDWGGFASWSAVAFEASQHDQGFAREIIELEIQLQALWCYCNCVDALGALRSNDYGKAFLRRAAQTLARPVSTEHVSRRLMREALKKTSRIQEMVEGAIETLALEEIT